MTNPFDPVVSRGYVQDARITEGGVAEKLWDGAVCKGGWAVYNCDSENVLWVSSSADAGPNLPGSICVSPLGGYETPAGYNPCGYVSIFGSVTGQPYTARGW